MLGCSIPPTLHGCRTTVRLCHLQAGANCILNHTMRPSLYKEALICPVSMRHSWSLLPAKHEPRDASSPAGPSEVSLKGDAAGVSDSPGARSSRALLEQGEEAKQVE